MKELLEVSSFFPLIILLVLSCHLATSATRIKTKNGKIKGLLIKTSNNRSANVYYGIPFAKPPVGELRFKPPIPIKSWDDVLAAKTKPPACIQESRRANEKPSKFGIFAPSSTDPVSEDCLYLNIWTPATLTKNLAIMIFIYGGAYKSGSSTVDLYDGGVLASEEGVIVVTFNFRQSLFGFLYLDDSNISGNVGLMDQAMAFNWVRDNIKAFRGDPNRITIYGQSSGGASVSIHLILPSSQGLFARVIVESGSVFSRRFYRDKKSSRTQSENLAKAVGCDVSNLSDTASCLRSKIVDDLINASITNKLQFLPTIDGVYFPYTPMEMLRKGYLNKFVNIIIGHTTGDGFKSTTLTSGIFNDTLNFFVPEDYFTKYVIKTLGTSNDADLVTSVKRLYSENYQSGDNYRRPLVELVTDSQVTCSINQLADMAAKNGNTVYKYLYSHVSSVSPFLKWEEVTHGSELFFVFGKPLDPKNYYSVSDVAFSKRMMKYWTRFAKFGFPSDICLNKILNPEWPIYNTNFKEISILDNMSKVKSGINASENCDLLLSVPTYNDRY